MSMLLDSRSSTKWRINFTIFFPIYIPEVSSESSLSTTQAILTQIETILGQNRLLQRKLDLRLRADISAVEREMAELMKRKSDDETLAVIKAIVAGESISIKPLDPHVHINLVPELKI